MRASRARSIPPQDEVRERIQPLPRVRVRPAGRVFSMNSMIVPATSLPVAVSMPSSPGEELTSMTTGPWFERSRSTPATFSPMTFAARTAVRAFLGGDLDQLGGAAAVEVGAELALLALALHGGDDLVADHEAADVGAAGLLDELLHQDVGVEPAEGLDDRLGGLRGLGQHHADALGALEQLDDQRSAAADLDQVARWPSGRGRSR